MIAELKPYADYKDSGLPWLGQVPGHLRTVRNGSLFGQRSQTGYAELPIPEVSLKTGVQVRSFGKATRKQIMSDLGKYKRAVEGDLAYNTMRMWQGALGVCPVDGLVSPAYVVARPFPGVDARYFAALFRTGDYMAEIDSASRGIVKDRNRLYWDQFKQMQSPCPPLAEQLAIMRFLDWANGRLERTIKAKRKVIALLVEQRQAIIHRAVTRGLDPNVPLKPSGVPWIGDAPQHWETKRLKSIAAIRYGLGQPPRELRDGLPMIRATNVDHGRIVSKNLLRVDPGDVPRNRNAFLAEGEIVVVRSGAYTADSAIIPKAFAGSVAGYDMVVTVNRSVPEFVACALLCSYIRLDQLVIASMRAAQPHLNAEELGCALILLPPRTEQVKIVHRIQSESEPINIGITRLEREIDLIREYRIRVVSDVVTGKLDVREVAAQLPDEATPDTLDDLADETDEVEIAGEEAEA